MRGILPFFFLLFVVSCSTTQSIQPSHLEEQYRTSRSAIFQYRLPVGWLDTTDAAEPDVSELWLVSPDLRQSIQARRLYVDAGLSTSAVGMLLQKMMAEDGVEVANSVSEFEENGGSFWNFRINRAEGIRQSVTLFESGEQVLEMRMTWQAPEDDTAILEMQNEFLKTLRWE